MSLEVKKKIGPLPLYAWIGIGTVAVLALYLRSRANSTAPVTETAVPQSAPTIDPTTGLPYSGFPASGASGIATPDASYTTPNLSGEIQDVLGLLGAFQGSGLLTQPSNMFSDEQLGQMADVFGRNVDPQIVSNHSAPTPVGDRHHIVVRPSAKHDGKLYDYVLKVSNGKTILTPIGPSKSKTVTKLPSKKVPKPKPTEKAKHSPKKKSTHIGTKVKR